MDHPNGTRRCVVILFIVVSSCFSSNLPVFIKGPYAGGSVVINNKMYEWPKHNYDSITFSNGILLSFYHQKSMIPEPPPLLTGIAVDSTPYMIKAGFKYESSASWKTSATKSKPVYYASGDTIWTESKKIPDSLVLLDSLHTCDYPSQLPKKGKWLFCTHGDLTFYWDTKVENFNTIFYLQAPQSKMKIQVSSIFTSFHTGIQVDSLKLVWMVDSAGNGEFKDNTGINDIPGSPQDRTISEPRGKARLRDLMNSCNRIGLYTISGRKVRYSGVPLREGDLPGGVLLYRTDGPASFKGVGKIVVR